MRRIVLTLLQDTALILAIVGFVTLAAAGIGCATGGWSATGSAGSSDSRTVAWSPPRPRVSLAFASTFAVLHGAFVYLPAYLVFRALLGYLRSRWDDLIGPVTAHMVTNAIALGLVYGAN